MGPIVSVIIPGYNRATPLRATLRSVAEAATKLERGTVETILVDDGSNPSLADQLTDYDLCPNVSIHRQENAGSIVARNHGLELATGKFVQFLDSDDLLHPDKFLCQVSAQEAADADVSYCDCSVAAPGVNYRTEHFHPTATLPTASTAAEVFLRVQPPPHSPIYRRDYLRAALASPIVSARRRMDPAGDVWLYYNLCAHRARFVKVKGHFAATGIHADQRYSSHWEQLAIAALCVAEEFISASPSGRDAHQLAHARRVAGEVAFDSWRRLPWDLSPAFQSRLLSIWRRAPRGPVTALGGRGFAMIARLVGPVAAGTLLRRLRGGRYAKCCTLPPGEFERQLAQLPTF